MGEESSKNKVKFLCSYGGKVLPRPSDGVLKYVGGETRVICVPRDVTFSELMKKVSVMVDMGEVVLKYQLVAEDLDTLVSVRTQEDVKHMMEERDDGDESGGAPLLRTFLFPSSKPLISMVVEPYSLEQRYMDAINGIMIRTSPSPSRGAYSACCSPKSNSPEAHTHSHTTTADSPFHPNSHSQRSTGRLTMHKVQSSPNLSNLTTSTTNNNNHHAINIPHYHHPIPPHNSSSSFASRQQDPQLGMGGGRLSPIITDRGGFNYYYSTATRPHNKPCAYHEDSLAAPYAASGGGGHVMLERVHSVPRSPRNTIWE